MECNSCGKSGGDNYTCDECVRSWEEGTTRIQTSQLATLRAKAKLGEALELLPVGYHIVKRHGGYWSCSAHDNWSNEVAPNALSAVLAAKAAIEKGWE